MASYNLWFNLYGELSLTLNFGWLVCACATFGGWNVDFKDLRRMH